MPETDTETVFDEDAFDLLHEADELINFDAEYVKRTDDQIVARGLNCKTDEAEERIYEVDDTPSYQDHWDPWKEEHYTTDVPNTDITLTSCTQL
jgi:hypothetical protein